jgi:adenine-specific DNA-methyltransferase
MRRFILVELGTYFATVLKPRIWKAMFSSKWSGGNSLTYKEGQSGTVKCFSLESYEDSLNNLPSPDGKLFEAMDQSTRDSLITYSLDLELGPHLLNMDSFKDPWGYRIYAQLAGEAEVSLHNVDMVETFNYLIGLKVQTYGPIERYSAEFVRLPHGDDNDAKGNPLPDDKREGRLRVEGRLRRDTEGPYMYQRVEGELNDGNATRLLVIWRKLTDDAEKDAAVLEAWMARHRENTKERSDYREFHLIYLNGPITLPQPTQELRTVLPTEQTFKDRMFEDTEV